MSIIFDEARHEYWDGEEKIPSVTQILKKAGLIDDRWFREEKTELGTLVHSITAMIDRGLTKADEWIGNEAYPYLQAWERFLEESGWRPLNIEVVVYNQAAGYAGTYDRIMINQDHKPILIDIKTGQPADWHGLQLAAYAMCLDSDWERTCSRRTVHLYKTGKYSVNAGKKHHYDEPYWNDAWSRIFRSRIAK
jgi:hypothetical protein